MFELLLLIYLLPVIFVEALLLKLALWLVKKIFQMIIHGHILLIRLDRFHLFIAL